MAKSFTLSLVSDAASSHPNNPYRDRIKIFLFLSEDVTGETC